MKVAAVTATRAEFGMLTDLLRGIHESSYLDLKLIVTGTHLLEEFGDTVRYIQSAGIPISCTVNEITHAHTDLEVANQVGAGIGGFAKALSELEPDMIVILGDRYEMLAASIASFFLGIPILHIHGGEVTEGAFDDSIRHTITKLASLHCVAHETYARRVIQLGEHPDSVHVVGGLGADGLSRATLKSRAELESDLNIKIRDPLLLVTQHPVTSGPRDTLLEATELIHALNHFEEATVIFTMPNADPEHRVLEEIFRGAVEDRRERWYFFKSLGQVNYWSLMAEASAVVGNSSSGILEAPSLGVPTVNIGHRQKGRIFAPSIVSCEPTADSIVATLRLALEPRFRKGLKNLASPFSKPDAAERILTIITSRSAQKWPNKVFYDIPSL